MGEGQTCGSCHGTGTKITDRFIIVDEKSVKVPEVLRCPECQGTGWLYGRVR